MEEINVVRREFDEKLEHVKTEVSEVRQSVAVFEEKVNNTNLLIQQNTEVLGKLNETIQDNRIAMEKMSSNLELTAQKVEVLDGKIAKTDKKVADLQDERNFNFLAWIKAHLVEIILAGSLIYSLLK